jgi:glycosyltransferase involved in cell wall biosynthesis
VARVPLVLSVYDLSIWTDPRHYSRAQRSYYGSLLRLLLHHARLIIVPSEATRVELSSYRLRTPVRVMPLPVHAEFLGATTPAAVEGVLHRLCLVWGRYLLYTGGLHARKDLETLLRGVAKAQARAPGIGPLVVTGPRSKAFEARGNDLRCWLCCTGIVDVPVLRSLYEGCAVVVNASVNEGFGYPAAEAAVLGKPVVCPNAGSLAEAAGQAAVIFTAGEPEALSESIFRALKPSGDMRHAWARERNRAAERFSMEAAIAELMMCYRSALA